MELLPELLISLGSAISAIIGGFVTARRRKAMPEEEQGSTPVEIRVMGKDSKPVRVDLPPDVASRLMREARPVTGSDVPPAETHG
jgi:hypothetical protein